MNNHERNKTLRIGNYVLWQGKIVEVISIMPRWACVRYDFYVGYDSDGNKVFALRVQATNLEYN